MVYGIDEPKVLEIEGKLIFEKEHEMTPDIFVEELKGMEKDVFKKVYGGSFAKKMYRLYEYVSV